MASPNNSIIVLDDSSDEEPAPAPKNQSVESSIDHIKSGCVNSPIKPSKEPKKSSKILNWAQNRGANVKDASLDNGMDSDDACNRLMPCNEVEVHLSKPRSYVNESNDSEIVAAEATTQLYSDHKSGHVHADVKPSSDLQVQQLKIERPQVKTHSTFMPRTTTPQVSTGAKRKAAEAIVSPAKTQLEGSVLKKRASRAPFGINSSSSSDESSSSLLSLKGGTRATLSSHRSKLPSLKDVVALERALVRLRKNFDLQTNQNDFIEQKLKEASTLMNRIQSSTEIASSVEATSHTIIDMTASSESDLGDNDQSIMIGYNPKAYCQASNNYSPKSLSYKKLPSKLTQFDAAHKDDEGKKKLLPKVTGRKQRVKSKNTKRYANSPSTTTTKSDPYMAAQATIVSGRLTHSRSARNTAMHSTLWRNVYFETSPVNLLPLVSNVALPFFSEHERSLLTYDAVDGYSSSLKSPPIAIVSSDPELFVTQDDMDARVNDFIQQTLPRLRACHERKSSAILLEARAKVKTYLAALKTLQKEWTTSHPVSMRLGDVSKLEKYLLCQMKREKLTQKLSLGYSIVWGDAVNFKENLNFQDVTQLPSIRPLSKCTAYIGLKANIRVEDDPILRYKPYFGEDDDGADIDEAWYDAVVPEASSLSTGIDGEMNECMLHLVIREYGSSDQVFTALKKVSGFAQASSNYTEMKELNDSTTLAARRVEEAKNVIARRTIDIPLKRMTALGSVLQATKVSRNTLEERLAPPISHFDSNLAKNYAIRAFGLGLRLSKDYSQLLITYRDMFCRRCYDYHCLEHGIEHPLPSHRMDPMNPPLHLSAVALAARKKIEQNNSTYTFIPSPDSCTSSARLLATTIAPDSSRFSAEETKSFKGHNLEDVLIVEGSTIENGSIKSCYETATSEEVVFVREVNESRRSTRTATKISSIASQSLTKQTIRASRTKQSQRVQIYPPVADKSEYLDDSYYAQVTDVINRSLKADEECSSECWKKENLAFGETCRTFDQKKNNSSELSETEVVLLQKLRIILGDNACIISSIIKSLPCKEVKSFLESEQQSKSFRNGSMEATLLSNQNRSLGNGRKRSRERNLRNRNSRILLSRSINNRLKDKEVNHEYEPCNHQGACNSTDCSCMTRDHTCDKACSCSRDCLNRFPGCKCSLGNCRTKACPCLVAARECNPDTCFTCGASEVPAIVFDEKRRNMSALDLGICCNVNVLRGLHKKVGVAYSTTHGWGAFALQPIKRGEFIYEYHGALLSQDEAERRGSIYDKMTISFLFDVDDDSVVDAIRKGNKSKFANHSTENKNCKGKILTVKGEHRISIWAQQDIAKDEELFFDYGYHGETAPDWSQLRIQGSARLPS